MKTFLYVFLLCIVVYFSTQGQCKIRSADKIHFKGYTSYVSQDNEKHEGCNQTCVAFKLGIGFGAGALMGVCVCTPLLAWYCYYKYKKIKVWLSERRERNGYQMVSQDVEMLNYIDGESPDSDLGNSSPGNIDDM